MIKDHITLTSIFGKYRIVVPTRVEYKKNWPKQLRKRQISFTDGVCNQQDIEAGTCKYQNKIQWHISLGQDATAFQAEVMTILHRVTSNLRKKLVKEQITICTDSQAAIVALAGSGTKSPLVADCIEKLMALSEESQILQSVNSVLILYRTGNMQSTILLSFVTSSSLLPCGLQPALPPMPCYINSYVVYNVYFYYTE